MKTVIGCSNIEAMMHGVALYSLEGERTVTLTYTDGTTETGPVPVALASQVRAYAAYQDDKGPACEPPNAFSVVGWVQESRKNIE